MELGAKESLNNKSSYDRWAAEARWHDRHLTSPERNATMRLAGRQQPGKPSPTPPKAARQAVTGRSRFSLTTPMGGNAHPMRPQPPGVSRLHIQPMEYSSGTFKLNHNSCLRYNCHRTPWNRGPTGISAKPRRHQTPLSRTRSREPFSLLLNGARNSFVVYDGLAAIHGLLAS